MILVQWLDEVQAERQNVQKFFGKLDKFRDNIKPFSNMTDSVRSEVERLINSAFQCHLTFEHASSTSTESPDWNTTRSQASKKRKANVECLLCKAKNVLEVYECVIFDKKFVPTKDKELVRGSWKPAYQEQILKGNNNVDSILVGKQYTDLFMFPQFSMLRPNRDGPSRPC